MLSEITFLSNLYFLNEQFKDSKLQMNCHIVLLCNVMRVFNVIIYVGAYDPEFYTYIFFKSFQFFFYILLNIV